ncbi:MAG: helix-hairpin-helix domain-containing protein [Gemmatimonadaceae bacterium]
MDSRTAAHVLSRIAAFLELRGENPFKARAYRSAAKAILDLAVDDLTPLVASGDVAGTPGVGPATLAVIRDLVTTGESPYYERLRESTPEGLLGMLRVSGLGTAKIHQIHATLGIETVAQLEEAAVTGRLAKVKGFGPKTAARILRGIALLKESDALSLYPHARAEAQRLLTAIRSYDGVQVAEVAGSIRRRCEVIRDIDIVVACTAPVDEIARGLAGSPGVRTATGSGVGAVTIHYVDGTLLDLVCVQPDEFSVAFWRATGSAEHVAQVEATAARRGISIGATALTDPRRRRVEITDEHALYATIGLRYVVPELREGRGEVDAALSAEHTMPSLVDVGDVRGVLHCHSVYSDGKATIADMAAAARARGWSYLGISDHSESAFYAGGVSREKILVQHDEIDAFNESMCDFRLLKGIEADILADGRLDYDAELLATFDYVIGSVHSRFAMTKAEMTSRVLRALDDPHLTILGHPTGRLLLSREPYDIDLDAVIEKAGAVGAAMELNADPHRLDLDWRMLRLARDHGVVIEVGPDAHSPQGLDNMDIGIGIARKGWLEPKDVLNTRDAGGVLAFARQRRTLLS